MIEKYLNNKFLTLYLIPFFIGSLSVLSFQPFNITLINFFILPTFFYLIIFIKKKSKSVYRKKPYKINLFILGTSFGFGFYLSGVHWIVNALTFDEGFKVLIPFALILIPLFLSIFFSSFTVLLGPFLNLDFKSILIFSGGLAFSDYLRAKILTGFPWNIWAYSFSWANEILQILGIFGFFSFNLIVVTLFTLPVIIFFKFNLTKRFLYLTSIPLILFILYIYGNYSINKNSMLLNSIEQKIKVKVISPNFKLEYGLTDKEIEVRLMKLIRYSEPMQNQKAIFIWPEGAFSGYSYNQLKYFKNIFKENFSKNHLILFGVNKLDPQTGKYFNSLVIVNNYFEIIREYKKQKLVPFGEFLPMEKFFYKLGLKKITEGYGSFQKGSNQKNLILDKMNILPLICYEIIFTKFIQKSDKNTNLIINISEDGWFGNSIGPHQHFAKAIFRAIEQDSFLLRSANKGISAIINNKGRVIRKLEISEAGNIDLEVPLIRTNKKNKNDLIFFILLFTYILFFVVYKKNND